MVVHLPHADLRIGKKVEHVVGFLCEGCELGDGVLARHITARHGMAQHLELRSDSGYDPNRGEGSIFVPDATVRADSRGRPVRALRG